MLANVRKRHPLEDCSPCRASQVHGKVLTWKAMGKYHSLIRPCRAAVSVVQLHVFPFPTPGITQCPETLASRREAGQSKRPHSKTVSLSQTERLGKQQQRAGRRAAKGLKHLGHDRG